MKKSTLLIALLLTTLVGITTQSTAPSARAETCDTLTVNDICAVDFYEALSLLESNVSSGIRTNTVTLYSDINDLITQYYLFPQLGNITIDMNGHSITSGRQWLIFNSKVTFTGTGTFYESNGFAFNLAGSPVEGKENFSVLTIGENVKLVGTRNGAQDMISVALTGGWLERKYGIVVNMNGSNEFNDSNSDSRFFYINGSYGDTNTIVNIGETANIKASVLAYVAAGATLNYAGHAEVQKAGIDIRGGQLNITGGSITVDPETAYTVRDNPTNGLATLGTAVTVTQHTSRLPISVNVSGGTLTAAAPFVEINATGSAAEDIEKVSLSVSGGTFISTSDEPAIYSENIEDFITGGSYSNEPDIDYIAPHYKDLERNDGYWIICLEGDASCGTPATPDEADPLVPDTGQGHEANILLNNGLVSAIMVGLIVAAKSFITFRKHQ